MLPPRAESRLADSAAPKLFKSRPQIQSEAEGRQPDVQAQAPPSRSAVVSVRASFGRSCQSRVLSSGANEDGRCCGLSSGVTAVEDSYRFAAFSHEFRNLRKSSRVSLSAASCARAAHSAAFWRQYPIFSCMTFPPRSRLRSRSPPAGAELGEGSIIPTPEERM